MIEHKTAFFNILGIAGQIGSGKSSLARELCKRLNGKLISFGSFVRSEANRRGIRIDRAALQRLGEDLIAELGPDEFVRQVLYSDSITSSIVIDGIRHVEIWQAIRSIAPGSILVYLDVPDEIRIARLQQRDNLDIDSIKLAMLHPMEKNIPLLRQYSNLVLFDDSIESMVAHVIALVR
jgi:cytidylate kinase